MAARKYNTLGNILYIIDRKGRVYINEYGRVKRSVTEFHYEIMTNAGSHWKSNENHFETRAEAMNVIKQLAGVL